VTAAVLAVDVATGSRLQLSSLWGLSPLDAGRFYGFGNVAFALFGVATLIAATWAADRLISRGHRRAAACCVAAIGAVAVVLDGWPSFGADFGGVIALIPGFALLTAGIGRLRVTPRRAIAVAGAAISVVVAIAVVDWVRPAANRTHLGRFVQQLLDGQVGVVLHRKLDANIQSFAQRPAISLLVLAFLVVTAVAVVRPSWIRAPWLLTAYATQPVLRPCVAACLLVAIIGLVTNDSGIIIPAIAVAAALPLFAGIRAGNPPTYSPAEPSTDRIPPDTLHPARR
jgi:uncharacterized protein YggT (Ycf19 family)